MADLESFVMSLPPQVPAVKAFLPVNAAPAQPLNLDSCHAVLPLAALPLAALPLAVLRLTEVALDVRPPADLPAQQSIEPWQRLLAVIDELRSLDRSNAESSATGGLPNLPQTPEAIIPYVLEEICDVLDAPKASTGDENLAARIEPLPQYFLIETLAPWLLWGVASSAYEMMQMMEGIPVRVFQSGQGWQTGVLRLSALLKFESMKPEASWLIDLSTYQPPKFLLTPEMLLQSDDCQACQQPISSHELLQCLVKQLKTTSVLRQFLEGIKTTLLMPGKTWDAGLLSLQPGFEFMAATEDEVADWVLSADSGCPINEVTGIASDRVQTLPLATARLALQFTDANWQKQYAATIVKHLQAQSFYHYWHLLPQFADSSDSRLGDRDPIPLLIEQAWEASHALKTSMTFLSRNFLHQPINIADLLRRLMWCLSSSAFEIMLLIGGIQADLLQPESGWSTGTLRLLLTLNIQTPELDWHLNIATGQMPRTVATPTPDTVVRSNHCQWCDRPSLIADLLNRVDQQIDRSIPELQLLRQGTSADILMAVQNWQPSAVWLSFDFEFIGLP